MWGIDKKNFVLFGIAVVLTLVVWLVLGELKGFVQLLAAMLCVVGFGEIAITRLTNRFLKRLVFVGVPLLSRIALYVLYAGGTYVAIVAVLSLTGVFQKPASMFTNPNATPYFGILVLLLLLALLIKDASYLRMQGQSDRMTMMMRTANNDSVFGRDLHFPEKAPGNGHNPMVNPDEYKSVLKQLLQASLDIATAGVLYQNICKHEDLVSALFLCNYPEGKFYPLEWYSENLQYERIFRHDVLDLRFFNLQRFTHKYNEFVDKKNPEISEFRKEVEGYASACGVVIELQKPKKFNDLSKCLVFNFRYLNKANIPSQDQNRFRFRSFFGIPVILHGKVVGVVALLATTTLAFKGKDNCYAQIGNIFASIVEIGLISGVLGAISPDLQQVYDHKDAVKMKSRSQIELFASDLAQFSPKFEQRVSDLRSVQYSDLEAAT